MNDRHGNDLMFFATSQTLAVDRKHGYPCFLVISRCKAFLRNVCKAAKKYETFHHFESILSSPFGSKVYSSCSKRSFTSSQESSRKLIYINVSKRIYGIDVYPQKKSDRDPVVQSRHRELWFEDVVWLCLEHGKRTR